MQPENQGDQWHSQTGVPLPFADSTGNASAAPAPQNTVSWQASEYIHHEKRTMWFVILFAAAIVLALIALLLIKSITFAILIVAMTVVVAVYAVRPPHLISYQLSPGAIRINEKTFQLGEFRYFGIAQEGAMYSALLIPIKRFLPAVTLYFPQENGEVIVDMLGSRLPMEKVELDIVERAMRYLRF